MTDFPEGDYEGDRCNRWLSNASGGASRLRCEGVMQRIGEENCSCHIHPPCSNCTDAEYRCSYCEFETEAPKWSTPPPTKEQEDYWAEERRIQDAYNKAWTELMRSREPVTELKRRCFGHTHCTQRWEGVKPPDMAWEEVGKICVGTFGGRFHRRDYETGRFEYIAQTD